MTESRDDPTFRSARGTVAEWIDRQGSRRAAAHYARLHYEVQMADIAARRARRPDWPEHMLVPSPSPSPNIPEIWEPEALAHEVRVLPPERSLTLTFRTCATGRDLIAQRTVDPHFHRFQSVAWPRVGSVRPEPGRERNDLATYCRGPHSREALALLQPRCFFHGRTPQRELSRDELVLGRPALSVPTMRTVPLTSPRILGDGDNPNILYETEHTEVVVDREYGVILEWRALFDGAVYERHYFTELAFNEPMSEDEFEIDPGGVG